VVVRRTDTRRLARGVAWAEAAVFRWCFATVGESVTVADAANDAPMSAPPSAQESTQRDICLNFRETGEAEARCSTICFSLKQRKNPCKIKSLRGFPQPDVERAFQTWTGLGMVRPPAEAV
jgi:hypothetical protein